MEQFRRFAIYYAPAPGPLADFCSAWLGWDAARGAPVPHPDIDGLPRPVAEITERPRKYGFHATIKPPFRLAPGVPPGALHEAAAAVARGLPPVTLEGLQISRLGAFLALTPRGDDAQLNMRAASVVEALDAFRAPPTDTETARRRKAGLTPRQDQLLLRWGYPYVMDEFRFHMTLTGPLPRPEAEAVKAALVPHVEPRLSRPYVIETLSLFGEDEDGRFHQLHRYTLSG